MLILLTARPYPVRYGGRSGRDREQRLRYHHGVVDPNTSLDRAEDAVREAIVGAEPALVRASNPSRIRTACPASYGGAAAKRAADRD